MFCSVLTTVVPYVDTIVLASSTYGIKDLKKDKVYKIYTKHWANFFNELFIVINAIIVMRFIIFNILYDFVYQNVSANGPAISPPTICKVHACNCYTHN